MSRQKAAAEKNDDDEWQEGRATTKGKKRSRENNVVAQGKLTLTKSLSVALVRRYVAQGLLRDTQPAADWTLSPDDLANVKATVAMEQSEAHSNLFTVKGITDILAQSCCRCRHTRHSLSQSTWL